MKVKVFTHTDLDGIGSVVLLNLIGFTVDYEMHNYITIDKAICDYFRSKEYLKYDMTFITDISVKKDDAIMAINNMYSLDHKIILLDHHKTAEVLKGYNWAFVNTNKPNCGTSLTYDYLKSNFKKELCDYDDCIIDDIERFVHLVSHWDTWLWQEKDIKESKMLNDLFYIYEKHDFLKAMVTRITQESNLFTKEDKIILKIKEKETQHYIQYKLKQLEILEYAYNDLSAGIVFAEDYISELGDAILEESDEIDFAMIINIGSKQISLRSRQNDDVDVEEIAKFYGGGGHKKAAGFKIKLDLYGNIIKYIL